MRYMTHLSVVCRDKERKVSFTRGSFTRASVGAISATNRFTFIECSRDGRCASSGSGEYTVGSKRIEFPGDLRA